VWSFGGYGTDVGRGDGFQGSMRLIGRRMLARTVFLEELTVAWPHWYQHVA
jgi:hypothetical protein